MWQLVNYLFRFHFLLRRAAEPRCKWAMDTGSRDHHHDLLTWLKDPTFKRLTDIDKSWLLFPLPIEM